MARLRMGCDRESSQSEVLQVDRRRPARAQGSSGSMVDLRASGLSSPRGQDLMVLPKLRRLFDLVARPFRGRAAVDLEISFHLEQAIADFERRGLDPAAARIQALRQFGDVQRY